MALLVILLLILINGVLAMSETSLVAARRVRLETDAARGNRRAAAALDLTANPTRFLSTVQIGITLVGILAGAFGEAAIADDLAEWFKGVPWLAAHARWLSLGITVLVITYFSLVFGELVPKRLAVGRPEPIAKLVARPMQILARVTAPAVHLLSFSTDLLVRLLGGSGGNGRDDQHVTDEEIQAVIRTATVSGVIHASEQDMVERVFRLGDQRARALMVPRTDIDWLDVTDTMDRVRLAVATGGHSHYPVCKGSLDELVGVLHVKDLVQHGLVSQSVKLDEVMRKPVFIPESTPALKVLDIFRQQATHIVFILDEYGSLEGMLTLNDVVERLVGDIHNTPHDEDPEIVKREDGSYLLDGGLDADELRGLLGVSELPRQDEGAFHTLAGFILTHLGHIPAIGESFEWERFRFEIVDMDRQRIDRVLVTPKPAEQNSEAEPAI